MTDTDLIGQLMEALRCLPGVGPKSAQRMAYYLLERDREGGRRLARALHEAVERVGNCARCRTLSESEICVTCADRARDSSMLCVVESPTDMSIIDKGTGYRGQFFVLMGHLSPLDGIGPRDLGLDLLVSRLDEGEIREVILATASTVEGQATAHYISELIASPNVRITRIAQGVPLGGELEFVDHGTLAHAIAGRQAYE